MNKQAMKRLDEVVEKFEVRAAGIYFFQPVYDEHGNKLLDEDGNELLSPSTSGNVYTLKEFFKLEEQYPDSIFLPPAEPLPDDNPYTLVGMTPEDLYAENEEGLDLDREREAEEEEDEDVDWEAELERLSAQPPPPPPPLTEITDHQRELMDKLERMQQRSQGKGRRGRR